MRRRPCSRAEARSAPTSTSHDASADSACTSAREDVPTAIGPNTRTRHSPQHHARGVDRVGRAAQLGEPSEGRESQHASPGALGIGHDRRVGGERGLDHVVLRHPGLHQHTPVASSASDDASGAHEQPERLFRGPVARRQQFLIELQERDQARSRPGPRRRGGSTASVPTSTAAGGSARRRGIHFRHRHPRQEGSHLLAHPRDPGPATGEAGAVAVQTDARPLRSAPAADKAGFRLGDRRAADLAFRDLPTLPADERWARPLRFTTQTARAPRSTVAWSAVVRASENKPLPGGSSRTSITSTRGQPLRSNGRAGRAGGPTEASASSVGAGLTSVQRAPARRARSNASSRAFHAGARSSLSASSPSSRTTIALRSGTGASTATLPPTTTHAPARARFQLSVRRASGSFPRVTITSRPA